MGKKETNKQAKLQAEKQELILRLRLAIETNHYEIVEELALDFHRINSVSSNRWKSWLTDLPEVTLPNATDTVALDLWNIEQQTR